MKKLLSFALAAVLLLGLPSLASAKGKGSKISGKVTAVTETTMTITEGKKQGGESKTINVPAGTPITDKDGGTAPALSDLVGKRVKVKEGPDGTAKEITVSAKGGKKNK